MLVSTVDTSSYLYGSGRLGSVQPGVSWTAASTYTGPHYMGTKRLLSGQKRYEIANHLGNVLTTIGDRKIPVDGAVADNTAEYYTAVVHLAQDYYPFGMEMPGRSFQSGGYRYGFNGMEKDSDILGGSRAYTTMHRLYDSNLGRWLSIDPETKQFPDLTPYNNNENDPISNTDPNGNCPWCLTAVIGAATGALVELGGQVISNVATGKSWNDIDYADVGIAAAEGGVIGLTGGLGAAGKVGKTAVKVVNTSAKISSASAQGAVDVKTQEFGGTKSILGTGDSKKDLGDAAIDTGFGLVGAAVGGKAPTGSKKVKGPIPAAATPKKAVKSARQSGPVNRQQRVAIETKAKGVQKARNVANETIRDTPGGAVTTAVENGVSDKVKDKKNGQ
jgi:RHS repeat-associated protein